LSAAKSFFRNITSPRTTSFFGGTKPDAGFRGMRSGILRIVRTLAVTSSPMMPLPRVAARVSRPSS
jgi:hypothetical protein